jgi:hypothetical protein
MNTDPEQEQNAERERISNDPAHPSGASPATSDEIGSVDSFVKAYFVLLQ